MGGLGFAPLTRAVAGLSDRNRQVPLTDDAGGLYDAAIAEHLGIYDLDVECLLAAALLPLM
jgi:hypothetical protein